MKRELEFAPVPFDQFPHGDLTDAEYVLENGEKLRHCPINPDYYISDNRRADKTLATPHIYEAVWDDDGFPLSFRQADDVRLEIPYVTVGPEIGIDHSGVPYGLMQRRTEPGYLLKNGTALLECERDAYGNYHGGVGMDGMFLKTGKLYAPVKISGIVMAFQEVREAMDTHPSIRFQLKAHTSPPERPAQAHKKDTRER